MTPRFRLTSVDVVFVAVEFDNDCREGICGMFGLVIPEDAGGLGLAVDVVFEAVEVEGLAIDVISAIGVAIIVGQLAHAGQFGAEGIADPLRIISFERVIAYQRQVGRCR